MFGQPVVALGSGVGVARDQGRFDGGPPCLDGGGEAVDFGCDGVGCQLVEGVEPGMNVTAVGAGAGQREEVTQCLLRGCPIRCVSDLA